MAGYFEQMNVGSLKRRVREKTIVGRKREKRKTKENFRVDSQDWHGEKN